MGVARLPRVTTDGAGFAFGGRTFMIIANDAHRDGPARFFPMTGDKSDSRQNIAIDNHIPTIYLVDSRESFCLCRRMWFPGLPDDFGRFSVQCGHERQGHPPR